jgi:hypothetical protein
MLGQDVFYEDAFLEAPISESVFMIIDKVSSLTTLDNIAMRRRQYPGP